MQICSKCIYDERVSSIDFDEDGVCNYCKQIESLSAEYGTGEAKGEAELLRIFDEIKKKVEKAKNMTVQSVSVEEPILLTCYTWQKNMGFVLSQYTMTILGTHRLRLRTFVRSYQPWILIFILMSLTTKRRMTSFRSFFLAGVAEIEASTDLALAETIYRAAWKYGIKYVLEGHSFETEGITPWQKLFRWSIYKVYS